MVRYVLVAGCLLTCCHVLAWMSFLQASVPLILHWPVLRCGRGCHGAQLLCMLPLLGFLLVAVLLAARLLCVLAWLPRHFNRKALSTCRTSAPLLGLCHCCVFRFRTPYFVFKQLSRLDRLDPLA